MLIGSPIHLRFLYSFFEIVRTFELLILLGICTNPVGLIMYMFSPYFFLYLYIYLRYVNIPERIIHISTTGMR